ncbi:MAG: hypothetical protein ACO3HJ_06480 [Methylophilaceae bacterium]|jgi:hypothetical protein
MKQLVNDYIAEFIKNEKKLTFNDFLKYFYFSFDEKIKKEKKEIIKNKYIKMRKSILQYILSNKILINNIIKKKITNKK